MAFKHFLIWNSYSIVRDLSLDHQAGIVQLVITVYASYEDSLDVDTIPALIQKNYIISRPSSTDYVIATSKGDDSSIVGNSDRILITDTLSENYGKILWKQSGAQMTESLIAGSQVLIQGSEEIYKVNDNLTLSLVEAEEDKGALWDSYFSIDKLSENGVSLTGQVYKYLKENCLEFQNTENC